MLQQVVYLFTADLARMGCNRLGQPAKPQLGEVVEKVIPHSGKKHSLPVFLETIVTEGVYQRWLFLKARAHVKRDRLRGHTCTGAGYREAIHATVLESNGLDAYTGEALNWLLISTYDNEASKEGRHGYKAGFALLPTVDHVDAAAIAASFKICGWRTNDAKHDLSITAFMELCRAVLLHAGYRVEKP